MNGASQRLDARDLSPKHWIFRDRLAYGRRVKSIKFAIQVGVNKQALLFIGIVHRTGILSVSIKRWRPRDSRDITVPIGTAVISAISRYPMPLISRSTMISRNSVGSFEIAASSSEASTFAINSASGPLRASP